VVSVKATRQLFMNTFHGIEQESPVYYAGMFLEDLIHILSVLEMGIAVRQIYKNWRIQQLPNAKMCLDKSNFRGK
jgi:hypothetical protein